MTILKYIGDGAYIPGVPRADMTQEMIDESGYTKAQLLSFVPPVYELADKPVVKAANKEK